MSEDQFTERGHCSYCDTSNALIVVLGERHMCRICFELGAAEEPSMMMRPARLDQLSRAVRLVLSEIRKRSRGDRGQH